MENALPLLLGSPGRGVTRIPEPDPATRGWVLSVTGDVSGKLSAGWETRAGWEWWWFTPIPSLKLVRLFPSRLLQGELRPGEHPRPGRGALVSRYG